MRTEIKKAHRHIDHGIICLALSFIVLLVGSLLQPILPTSRYSLMVVWGILIIVSMVSTTMSVCIFIKLDKQRRR